jgi:hypothetical protein
MAKVDRERPDAKALQHIRGLLDARPHPARVLCDLAQMNAGNVIGSMV